MESVKDRLSRDKLLGQLITSVPIDALLRTLQIEPVTQLSDHSEEGKALLAVVEQGLGVFNLNLIPPPGVNPERGYFLSFDGPDGARTGFRLAVSLEDGAPRPLFNLARSLASHGLVAAALAADGQTLTKAEGNPPVQITGAGLFLVLQGQQGGSVALSLSPNREAPDDVVVLQVQPPTVLLGGTGFGFEFTHGIVLDFADEAGPAEGVVVDGAALATPADTPGWHGIAVNRARFFLPKGVPFLGGHAVDAWLQLGLPPTPGIDLIMQATVPADGDRPAISVRIECRDATAKGLDGFVPTLVEAVMELPLQGRNENFGKALTFAAGVPVLARLRYARKPGAAGDAPASEMSLALESQGPDGLLKIDSTPGGLGAKIAVTAATLATALIAHGAEQTKAPDGDGTGVVLQTLLVAATGLSSFLEHGELVLHSAELVSTGAIVPAGKTVRLKLDYSVAATVTGIDVGVLSVQMHPNQPLRVRVREVVLSIDPSKPGLEKFHLDYARSSLEVEDPGGWLVQGPGSLFDVLGTRSGRGSMWIEVDLRFKLDLGPVKVSGATIRGTLDDSGKMSGELRGLAASIALDPMITGSGAVQLTPDGFRAAMEASIVPLGGMGASAEVETAGSMVKLALGVDLPGPLPLGNSGLAIYGVGGVFVANGKPKPVPAGNDPVQAALDWDYREQGAFVEAPSFSFGLEAVIGTAPDLGFTFSARAGLFVTTPDIIVRGSVEGRYMGPRMSIARGANPLSLLQAKGVILVDPADGVTVAVEGTYEIPHIVTTTVPVGAHFPTKSAAWFIHLGSDGYTLPDSAPSESRERGPVRSIFLPDILGQRSDAYLMMRGNGITKWPRGGPYTFGAGSFVIAFGVGFDIVYGFKPIVWADVFARADILVATHPMSFVGVGTIGGGLHIGIFSVGIDATINVVLVDGQPPHVKADLCGSIDLFFDEIRKCVTLEFGNPTPPRIPAPEHPLDGQVHSLVDDHYHRLMPLATRPEDATDKTAVWPDSIPLLAFSTAPRLSFASAQFPDAGNYPEGGSRAKPIGSELLSYDWELLDVALVDATEGDVLVAGPFSSAWLDGKLGNAGGQPQPAELALLTPYGDLWLHALGDAGAGLADPPLQARADICHLQAHARFGWALGASATREGSGYRLPPDPRSTDPLQSQVRARVELLLTQPTLAPVLLDKTTAALLPVHMGYTGPRVWPFAPQALDGREFDAWLDPGAVQLTARVDLAFQRAAPRHDLRIVPDEALTEPRLWLVVRASDWLANAAGARPFIVIDDLARRWAPDLQADLGDGWLAVRWQPPAGGTVKLIEASCAAGTRLGLLALGGITLSAAAAATARNAAAAAEAAKQKKAADDGPPGPDAPASATRRGVLDPGRLYRIDVRMRWSGTLYEMDDKGNKQVLKPQPADGTTDALRQYWFRTAPLLGAGGKPTPSTVAYLDLIHRQRDFFDPAMLERHLLGYEPAQSELHRFASDPVRMRFAPGHVALLAAAYKYELLCSLRRLDQPDTVEADQLLVPKLAWLASSTSLTGSAAVIADAYLASTCGLAPNAVELRVDVKLTRDTWYEVFALARSKREGVVDGRLPGVSFRTSRWADGTEMLAGLHFPISGLPGHPQGGVALLPGTVLAPRISNGDDAAFDAFLDSLGLDGWPAATEPRISLLWLPPAAAATPWRCAGVLIESPEPVVRDGRFDVNDLQLVSGASSANFNVRLRDRSGSRLLFATTAPFVPRRTRRGIGFPWVMPKLRLVCTDKPIGKPEKSLQGLLEIPLQPSFAEEAA
ncbi:hypothetical protein ACS5PN_05440 [Roseateles sp. NT4]|uniref:hypothetical protein n=1 Tax=Roseateles sp. NT4 TaxID=3453715 RepID=UPI003EECF09A